MIDPPRLRRSDIAILAAVWLAVSLPALLISHSPVSEEAAIAQSVRELNNGEAGELAAPPWLLEAVATMAPAGAEAETLRGFALVIGLVTVVLTGQLAARWFGRRTGLLTGLGTATSAGLSSAVWQSGTSIWIAAATVTTVLLFSAIDWPDPEAASQASPREGLRARSGRVARFVIWLAVATILVGAGNLLAVAGVSLLVFLIRQRRNPAVEILRSPAWLVVAALLTCAASLRLLPGWPDVVLSGGFATLASTWLAGFVSGSARLDWLSEFGQAAMPWGLLAPYGLWRLRHEAIAVRESRERLLLCISLAAPLFGLFLFPMRSELVLAASIFWSIPTAVALNQAWLVATSTDQKPLRQAMVPAGRIGFSAAALMCVLSSLVSEWSRPELKDEAFLAQVAAMREDGESLQVDLDSNDRARVLLRLDEVVQNSKKSESDSDSLGDSLRVLVISSPERMEGSTDRHLYRKILQSQHRGGQKSCLTLYELSPTRLAAEPRPVH